MYAYLLYLIIAIIIMIIVIVVRACISDLEWRDPLIAAPALALLP